MMKKKQVDELVSWAGRVMRLTGELVEIAPDITSNFHARVAIQMTNDALRLACNNAWNTQRVLPPKKKARPRK